MKANPYAVTRIFFDLDDDIGALIDCLAVLRQAAQRPLNGEEVWSGVNRVLLAAYEHALAIQEGFRHAFDREDQSS